MSPLYVPCRQSNIAQGIGISTKARSGSPRRGKKMEYIVTVFTKRWDSVSVFTNCSDTNCSDSAVTAVCENGNAVHRFVKTVTICKQAPGAVGTRGAPPSENKIQWMRSLPLPPGILYEPKDYV